jgi:hypothetical protein
MFIGLRYVGECVFWLAMGLVRPSLGDSLML